MTYESEIRAQGTEPVEMGLDGETLGGKQQMSRKRRNIVLALIAAVLVAIAAYFLMAGDDAPAEQAPQLQAVTVVAPGRTTVEGEITATGTLAARRSMPVGVVGEGGRVVSVPVDAGSWVRQGQVLAVIDRSVQSQQAQSAAAQIQVAQADANLAQANLDRALQLVERGFVSKADVDRLTATRDAAVARVRVAQAQSRELQARNARLNIVAPAAGLILERNVEPGQTVSGGSPPLFTIAKGGEMEMLAQLGETELASIRAGASAEVTPVGSDQSFTGQVWQVAPTIDPQTRQGTARVALSYRPELKPGGFASATINSGTVVAPVLPESAILDDDGQPYVYLVDSENKVARRDVETGMITSAGLTITEGLTGSERVVLRAGGFLREGQEVAPKLQKNAN
ncbi:efflux RND transporter periplasmic adaptor subunit [Qipengyuania sp. 1NDH17]|uniref:Efflux RND transporter periplasmic adaptor subunit n=1 Tax=Qipengyuania polymorpha TaxID=2867234 RepID=A0ABS7IZ14_9SPHN|nr:efflux RND transporter periplasmic adaptor subunit [Qipengyuania polymorpha]MBX7458806.1 efflux RND transporter periplasmic adaptor subunit [Qipengyuania polymorpha]